MSFSTFGLTDSVLRGIAAAGYTTPTEIQAKSIPPVMEGRDIIGCAPTGTGKTAAFVLPALHNLVLTRDLVETGGHPRMLVLTPTRELAQQIEEAVRTYGRFTGASAVSVYGGVDIEKQFRKLRHGCDIVVATPGRLLDHMERRTISLSQVEILVLDEADRMYDMGFINDMRRIIRQVPRDRQTLLFSATMPDHIRRLIRETQKNPVMVEVGHRTRPVDTVTQHFYSVPKQMKTSLLLHILKTDETVGTVLIFSRTKHGADRLARQLHNSGISTTALHADLNQNQRDRSLAGFKSGKFRVCVATDIVARGIDIDDISHVINYDTPAFAEDYIHRVGRTGRAEATGTALTFVSIDESDNVRKIEKLTAKKIELERYPGFTYPEVVDGANPVTGIAPKIQRTRRYYRVPRFA